MTKRVYGGREFSVRPRTVASANINEDPRFQLRRGDNPFIRAKEIAKSVKARDSQKFDDNILCAEIGGTLYIVDGFGRWASLEELGWDTVEVDVLCSRSPEKDAWFIALNANNTNRAERGYTKDEFAVNACLLKKEGYSVSEIATMQGCAVTTVQQRLARGQFLLDRDARGDVARLKNFKHFKYAQAAAAKAMAAILRLDQGIAEQPVTYDEIRSKLRDGFNVDFRVLAGDNEKVKGLLVDMLNNDASDGPSNYLLLFYVGKPDADTTTGHNTVEHLKTLIDLYLPELGIVVYADDLSDEAAALNTRAIARFVQDCRSRKKISKRAAA